jgi:hypothetical protein
MAETTIDESPDGGVLWKLHIWNKDQPDRSDLLNAPLDEQPPDLFDELRILGDSFQSYFGEKLIPKIDRSASRTGVIDKVTLFRSDHYSPDFVLFLHGIIAGDHGVIALIAEDFSVRGEEVGLFNPADVWKLTES